MNQLPMQTAERRDYLTDPLRLKWGQLPWGVQQQLRGGYHAKFDNGVLLAFHWQLDLIVYQLRPVTTDEERGWLTEQIVSAYERHVEGILPESSSPQKEHKTPGRTGAVQ